MALLWGAASASAQVTQADYQQLRINEILADNETTLPQNWRCRHVDMLELYNAGDKELPLSDSTFGYVRITDHSQFLTGETRYLSFKSRPVQVITAGQRIVIFCDENSDPQDRTVACENARADAAGISVEELQSRLDNAELHAGFALNNEGETLTMELVLHADEDNPVTLHEVSFPPLPDDVSYARVESSGTVEETWVFTKTPTFGECAVPTASGYSSCIGGANPESADPIEPNIELIDYTTNNPGAGEPVSFRVRVTDEKAPDEANLDAVEIHYRVDGGDDWQVEPMQFVELLADAEAPLELWSIWEGDIEGQSAGARVEFYFTVRDADGLEDSQPRLPMCPTGIGSCNPNDCLSPSPLECNPDDRVEELGPGCTAGGGCALTGSCELLQDCRRPFGYTVGSTYDGPLVITEIVPNNESIFEDKTEVAALCLATQPTCTFDDFIEIHNTSGLPVDLFGMVLAKGPFRPERGWTFGFGSEIPPLGHIIVWIDGDGVEPDPLADPPEPDNPTNWAESEFHTDFRLDATSDEIFLFEALNPNEFDPTKKRFQVVDGARWGTTRRYFESSFDDDPTVAPLPIPASAGVRSSIGRVAGMDFIEEALVRYPETRNDPWFVVVAEKDSEGNNVTVTPKEPNVPPVVTVGFRRGDDNIDGAVDVSDPISGLSFQFLGLQPPNGLCLDAMDFNDDGKVDVSDPIGSLSHQFLGLAPPPPPGKSTCGEDPTPDDRDPSDGPGGPNDELGCDSYSNC